MHPFLRRLFYRYIAPQWRIVTCRERVLTRQDRIYHKALLWKELRNPYKDRWFADPFILSCEGDTGEKRHEMTLLVEDFRYADMKGRISRLKVDLQRMEITDCKVVIEKDTHLSFPFIYRPGKMISQHEIQRDLNTPPIYIIPENSASGRLDMYEYDMQTDTCRFVKTLCDEPLVNAVIVRDDTMYATKLPDANGKSLGVYRRRGEKFVYSYSVDFQECIARNAGCPFMIDGLLLRPAQECNEWFGHAVSLQSVYTKNETLTMTELRRLVREEGFHTLNAYGIYLVADVKSFKHPRLSKLIYRMLHATDLTLN